MTYAQRIALVVILLSAAALRLTGLDWDGYQHHHPDERYISWVATTIELPSLGNKQWAAQWRPKTSTFNPFRWPPEASSEGIVVLQDQPRDFAYGHVPLYAGVVTTRLVEWIAPFLLPWLPPDWTLTADVLNGAGRIEYHHLTIVGRVLMALIDTGTILFLFLLGRRLFCPTVGLLAAALLATAVLPIQLAHFFTSDPYVTFFVVGALYFMVAAWDGDKESAGNSNRRLIYIIAAAVMTGLAIGSKFAAVLLVPPLLWTVWIGHPGTRRWRTTAVALVVALLTFAVTNPFALLDWTCRPLASDGVLGTVTSTLSRSCFWQNTLTQSGMVSGRLDLSFTRQYAGTIPFLYQFEMLMRWGLGPLSGLLGVAGLAWAFYVVFRTIRSGDGQGDRALTRLTREPIIIVLLWVVPYLLLTGSFYVKFLRYMQPVVPFMLLFGVSLLWQWRSRLGRTLVASALLFTSALFAVGFVSLYSAEHPWNAASRWIYENIPAGTRILSEQWDDYLPVTMRIAGAQRLRSEYPNAELTWLNYPDAADDEVHLAANLDLLAGSDYLTILSNRVYDVMPRQPNRYPLSSQYHQLLFDGDLGYELVWVGSRTPRLFGISFQADTFDWVGLQPPAGVAHYMDRKGSLIVGRADESFTVYDQPLTMIFRNAGKLSAEDMRAAFKAPGND
ncbi:MAG: glycosyltransferase family 39 protein [Candidatus Promineofilum sp.]|nr:glycosyltransferase family 39 protein [Promineifilum sp.]